MSHFRCTELSLVWKQRVIRPCTPSTSLHKADLRFAQSVPESSRGSVVIASFAARPVSPSLLPDDVTPLDSTGGVDKDTSSSPSRGDLVFLMDGVVGSGSPRFRAVWT